MPKKYRIKLSRSERSDLEKISRQQRVAASKKQRARIFLYCDENRAGGPLKDSEIAQQIGFSVSSIERLRKQCHEMGPIKSLERKQRATPPRKVIMDGEMQSQLMAQACSPPPAGHARWTLRLLAERLVELDLVEEISHETVRVGLKKTNCSLIAKSIGASQKQKAPPL
jgi:transposase